MAAVYDAKPAPAAVREWLPVGLGLAVLYVPTFYDLARGIWQEDEYAHGPIILAVVGWLFWRGRAALLREPETARPLAGIGVLCLGLLLYAVGRGVGVSILEIGSMIPVVGGTLVALRGWGALRAFWFPLLFIAFMVPLPGFFVDALTGPLKKLVSQIAEQVLYLAGYPIARNGVMLTIGQYELLVADACSGLNSMFSLTALGLLYLYVMRRSSWLHNGLVLLSILPIAFAANIIRVLTLVLITYHFGDAAGQGFLHGGAGMVLLLAALAFILSLDAVLAGVLRARRPWGRNA